MPSNQLLTDACTEGGAAFYKGGWFNVDWYNHHPDLAAGHINTKKLHVVCIAAGRSGPVWANTHLVVYTDNMNTMYAIRMDY